MRKSRPLYLVLAGAVLVVMLTLMTLPQPSEVFAQGEGDPPAAETVVSPPAETPVTPVVTDTPTNTPVPTDTPTNTPVPGETATATNTPVAPETVEPGETLTPTPVPPAAPVAIPEPITVVLFGTGLAALSAAAASRRKNDGKGDSE